MTLAGRTARSRVVFGPHETNFGRVDPGNLVTLLERQDRTGGQVNVAASAQSRAEFFDLTPQPRRERAAARSEYQDQL